MTHRQYLAWLAWSREQLNIPSRSDYYAMQVAAEVRRGNVEKPADVDVNDMVLKFGAGAEEEDAKPMDPMLSKSIWLGMFGIKANE